MEHCDEDVAIVDVARNSSSEADMVGSGSSASTQYTTATATHLKPPASDHVTDHVTLPRTDHVTGAQTDQRTSSLSQAVPACRTSVGDGGRHDDVSRDRWRLSRPRLPDTIHRPTATTSTTTTSTSTGARSADARRRQPGVPTNTGNHSGVAGAWRRPVANGGGQVSPSHLYSTDV